MQLVSQRKARQFWTRYHKIIVASALIGFLCALLADALKRITEFYEDSMLHKAHQNWVFFILFPLIGLSVIYFLRQYLFKKKENKGIKEIFDSIDTKHNELPIYKIPSHFINGLITVIFGGSTGIEVSTVVASATVGSVTHKKDSNFRKFKKELICAAIAAGITALFNSPIAGILFSLEVVSKKINKHFVLTNLVSVATAWGINFLLDEKTLFSVSITHWNYEAIPYFILLGIFAGLNSVYLTKCVIYFKQKFSSIRKHSTRIMIGWGILSVSLLFFPQLYGEGYHSVKELFYTPSIASLSAILSLGAIILLKPVVTSATLASGGDGGVFAPSLFIGAFLGLFMALVLNTFFNQHVIPVNFMLAGMAAVLSASIHAPFTALFLACGLVGNYTLIVPILIACIFAKTTAKLILPYNVYTYKPVVINNAKQT